MNNDFNFFKVYMRHGCMDVLITIFNSFNIYDEYMSTSTNGSNLRMLPLAKHHSTNFAISKQ